MPKNKQESRLRVLIGTAKERNIEVRSEKLLREVGYRARSGCCRVKGKNLILLDRDASITEQVEFLASVLASTDAENR